MVTLVFFTALGFVLGTIFRKHYYAPLICLVTIFIGCKIADSIPAEYETKTTEYRLFYHPITILDDTVHVGSVAHVSDKSTFSYFDNNGTHIIGYLPNTYPTTIRVAQDSLRPMLTTTEILPTSSLINLFALPKTKSNRGCYNELEIPPYMNTAKFEVKELR